MSTSLAHLGFRCFFFDFFLILFDQSPSFRPGASGTPRMLLLTRAWHPELDLAERRALRHLVKRVENDFRQWEYHGACKHIIYIYIYYTSHNHIIHLKYQCTTHTHTHIYIYIYLIIYVYYYTIIIVIMNIKSYIIYIHIVSHPFSFTFCKSTSDPLGVLSPKRGEFIRRGGEEEPEGYEMLPMPVEQALAVTKWARLNTEGQELSKMVKHG